MLHCFSQSVLLVMEVGLVFLFLVSRQQFEHLVMVVGWVLLIFSLEATVAYSRVLLQSVSTPSHGSGVGPPSFGEKATLVYTRVLL